MPRPPTPIRIGLWELHHNILRPSHCLLQLHNTSLLTLPFIPVTLHLTGNAPTPDPPTTSPTSSITLPRHLLMSAGGPFRALVSPPFLESRQTSITIHESPQAFSHIHRFLTCQTLYLNTAPPDLALVADRWGLVTLFDALFLHAEIRTSPLKSWVPLQTSDLILNFLPIMSRVSVPPRFKRFLAMRLALDLELVDAFFDTCDRDTYIHHLSHQQHDPQVESRRNKLDGKATTAKAAACAAVAPDAPGSAVVPHSTVLAASVFASPEHEVHADGTLNGAPATQSTAHPDCLQWNGHAASSASAQLSNGDADGNSQHVGQNAGTDAGGGNGNQGEQVEVSAGDAEVQVGEEPAVGSGWVPSESTTAIVELSGADSEGSYTSFDGDQSEGVHSNGSGEHWPTDAVEEGEEDEIDAIRKPCVPFAPYPTEEKEWHREFDIWHVFLQQKMMRMFVHYLSNYGRRDFRVFLLDLILGKLEPTLDDDLDVVELLRQVDWFWEGATYDMLSPELTKEWTPRAWRLLALAQLQSDRHGVDVRMTWRYGRLCRDLLERAAQLANKTDESDGNSTHSSDDENELGFSMEWDGRGGDQGFDFGMSLHCTDLDPNEMTALTLNIRLLDPVGEVFDKKAGRREVTTRIKVIESGCGCSLEDGDEFQGFTASPTMNAEERVSELDSFRGRGCRFTVMESEQLEEWMKRHKIQCGLVFQVRLYIFPGEDGRRRGERGDENKGKCVCGACECEACEEEAEEFL